MVETMARIVRLILVLDPPRSHVSVFCLHNVSQVSNAYK